jgi:hypothetical protein
VCSATTRVAEGFARLEPDVAQWKGMLQCTRRDNGLENNGIAHLLFIEISIYGRMLS